MRTLKYIQTNRMKSTITTLLLVLITALSALGQDVIKTRSGAILRGKVLSVTSTTVTYKNDIADSATIVLNAADLTSINYANGTKDIFESPASAGGTYSTATLMQMGRTDAMNNYKGYRSAKGLTTVITAMELPYGLIPAIACASTRPKDYNLDAMNYELIDNPLYRESYANEAFRIKKREVWKGFGNGFIIGAVIYGAIFSVAMWGHH